MNLVFQTTRENCLSACVASVLGIPLEEVPLWWELTGDEWLRGIRDWADSRGLGVCYFNLKNRKEWPLLHGHLVIVGGSTPRSDKYLHAIVARAEWDGAETKLWWVHDPFPGGKFIQEPDHCLFFVNNSDLQLTGEASR